jgi:hypothetical protein
MSTDRYAAFGDHLTADFKAQSFGGRVETGFASARRASKVATRRGLGLRGLEIVSFISSFRRSHH